MHEKNQRATISGTPAIPEIMPMGAYKDAS
jgi:hypothetical protein